MSPRSPIPARALFNFIFNFQKTKDVVASLRGGGGGYEGECDHAKVVTQGGCEGSLCGGLVDAKSGHYGKC